MSKQIYKLHSHQKLTSYMKKFSSIEKSLLFEINDDRIIAKTHTPDKSVVKIGSILLTDIMDPVSGKENVKIGLFAVDNFIASFKHFGESETRLEINVDTVGGDNVSTDLKAVSKNLKVTFPCASISMFRYIDSGLATKLTDTSASLFSFRVDKDTLSKVSSLTGIDSDNDILSIKSEHGNVSFCGKSFEQTIPGVLSDTDGSISFYKSHLSFLDKEDFEVFVLDNKVIFKSLETDTTIIIGKTE